MRLIAAIFLYLILPALANSDDVQVQKVFVPFEPYIAARREAYKEEWYLKYGCSEEHIEAMLDGSERTGFIFAPDQVAAAFAVILDSDRLNISCINDPVRMEFLSVMSTNTVMVKTVLCDTMRNGMQCTPPSSRQRYFLIDPAKTIELSDNVTFEEATRIVDWFRHDAGTALSDEEKNQARQLSWRAAIGRDGEAYTFRAGDPYCECVLSIKLAVPGRFEEPSQIIPIGKPQFVCPTN